MKELNTEIVINATPDVVWQILTDFPQFEQWNPFIRSIQGKMAEGSRLQVQIQPSGGNAMAFQPQVITVIPKRELCWLGRLLLPGLFDGEHRFCIESIQPSQVRFLHSEKFAGVLVPFLWQSLEPKARQGFEAMNQALKARAEAYPNAPSQAEG